MINIAQVQVMNDPQQLPRCINQIQTNIIDGINRLQIQAFNTSTVIGQEITAYLTEDQFQQQAGTNWVLADGRNIAGSAFSKLYGSNTLPDRRGTVSRMMDNGRGLDPAGDLPLGTYEADQFEAHTHTGNGAGSNEFIYNRGSGGTYAATAGGTAWDRTTVPASSTSTPAGGPETRVKAVIANVFIRIN